MSMMSNELLLCADACPEVMPVAARDPAIMTDRRVLQQLLRLEMFSVPSSDYFAPTSTSELQPYMRRVVTTWMLEVIALFQKFQFNSSKKVELQVNDFSKVSPSCFDLVSMESLRPLNP